LTYQKIEKDFDGLMRDAMSTAEGYLARAKRAIDEEFGEGFAAEHPELVVGFMQTAAIDFHGAVVAQQVRAGLNDLGDKIPNVSWDPDEFLKNGLIMVSQAIVEGAKIIRGDP
jgi:hypothetical protein